MPKLTLSVDETVVSGAKRYARQHGLSVSQMVETYLGAIAAAPVEREMPPVLRSVRGILKNADADSYRRHLARKYR